MQFLNLNEIAEKKRNERVNSDDLCHLRLTKLYEKLKVTELDGNKDMNFQVFEWFAEDVENDEGVKKYTIYLFGRCDIDNESETICVQVNNYEPSFFIEKPHNWTRRFFETKVNSLVEEWNKKKVSNVKCKMISDHCKFWGFTAGKKYDFMKFEFDSLEGKFKCDNALSYMKELKYIKYESNIEPFLRCMHETGVQAVGNIMIKSGEYKTMKNATINDIMIECDWKALKPVDDCSIKKYTIAAFDLECDSIDGTFPQASRLGDRIIQIGTTFSRFGEEECYKKHIITLGTCDPIDGVEVESYETEREVLLAWTQMMIRENPDIVTGYNIFGFDFKYMYARSKMLCLANMENKKSNNEFMYLSRFRNRIIQKLETKRLASSALGENILEYIDMHGRVPIDLMKVVQRDYKLDSYKLDYISSYFIKEQIVKLETNTENKNSTIDTKNTYGLRIGQYITVYYTDGITNNKHMDGKKFKVIDLEKNKIIVNEIIDDEVMKYGYKVYWCQAKDDISPRDIFRLQKGSSSDRKIIAQYCIQDCELCNKLMSKLQVLINNIGMANVCNVPFSYLFMRGQGVKIFSLVAKKCKERKHLIPTLAKRITSGFVKKKEYNEQNETTKIFSRHEMRINQMIEFEEKVMINEREEIFPLFNKKKFKIINISDGEITIDAMLEKEFYETKSNKNSKNVEKYSKKFGTSETNEEMKNGSSNRKYFSENMGNESLDDKKIYWKTSEDDESDNKIDKIIDQINKIDGDSCEETGYEGAIVFDPKAGVYHQPIVVLDYASLYPSAMINRNASHECFVIDDEKYGNIEGYNYYITSYSTAVTTQQFSKKTVRKLLEAYEKSHIVNKIEDIDEKKLRFKYEIYDKDYDGKKRWKISEIRGTLNEIEHETFETTKFAENKDGTKGIIPQILLDLLAARSKYKKEMENEKDPFKKSIYNGLQLAYKVTANSLYGQTGSSVSAICMKQIAATTTATGRNMLFFSKDFIENIYGNMVNKALSDKDDFMKYCFKTFENAEDKKFNNSKKGWTNRGEFFEAFHSAISKTFDGKTVDPEIIYGDTDSVFFNMQIKDNKTKEMGRDKEALKQSIVGGIWASNAINCLLPDYLSQEYEKVLYPFIILSKKKYVGNLYEEDPNKFVQKSMGIVLKRRDNAQIVKIICGGIINKILNDRDNDGAVKLTKKALVDMMNNKYPIDKFVITKTLRDTYKNRTSIAHAVLADRIAERDPGNKPMPSDRIPYAYVQTKQKTELQGDKIETPEYILANNLKLDYLHYIEKQIQNPALQFLELIVDNPQKIFTKIIDKEKTRQKGSLTIDKYFQNDSDKNKEYDENDIII